MTVNESGTTGGDAGRDEPDVGQTSREDLGQASEDDAPATDPGPAFKDDDIAAGHLGEPGGPAWSRE